jgi:hypothetical protein
MTTSDDKLCELECVDQEKDLGVLIDQKLEFKQHVQAVVTKANRIVGMLKSAFKHLDKTSLLLLYKSLVRPILEYASPVWNMLYKREIRAIENVQRRITKLLPSLRELSYEERLSILDLQTLEFRRLRNDLVLAYKIINNLTSMDKDPHCNICECSREIFQPAPRAGTRGTLYVQYATGTRAKYFSTTVTKTWNSLLSQNTIASPDLATFKRYLEEDLRNHPRRLHPS